MNIVFDLQICSSLDSMLYIYDTMYIIILDIIMIAFDWAN